MDKALATRVKELRCGKVTHSWRRIAEIIASEYPGEGITSGDQMDGKWLCDDAAKLLGEDPGNGEWN
jgi:hypothetical protein